MLDRLVDEVARCDKGNEKRDREENYEGRRIPNSEVGNPNRAHHGRDRCVSATHRHIPYVRMSGLASHAPVVF